MLFHLHLKFLLYDLYPLNLQEFAMPSAFIFTFKLLFISCKERSNKLLDDVVRIYFNVLAPPHGT